MTSQHAYIAAAFFLGMAIALLMGQVFHAYLYENIEPKHVPATLAPLESDETHTGSLPQHQCKCKQITYTTPRFSPIPGWTIEKPTDPLELQQVQLKGIYFNENTMKLMAVTVYGDYIEIQSKDIILKKSE